MSRQKKLTGFIFSAIILSAVLLINFIRQQYTVPILMYHSVNPGARPEDRLTVSVESFKRQMRFFKSHHYNVVPLEELEVLLKDKKKVPPKTVAITFDDGYKDNYRYAFPILKEYGFAATMFIIIDEVGRPQEDRLSWEEIELMRDSGIITFGSHCLGPEPLIDIASGEEQKRQIGISKKILEERLGKTIPAFSYPEGRFNKKIRELVIQAGYKLAVTTNPGKKFSNNDIFALKRIRISSTSDNLFVFWVETSGYYNFVREHRHK